MKMPALTSTCVFGVSRWAWTALLALAVLPGCMRANSECYPRAIFSIVEPERKAGAAPFSIDRLGPEVEGPTIVLAKRLDFLSLKPWDRVHTEWSFFDSGYDEDFDYSPEEGLARGVNGAEDVFPMKKLSDERVLMGFESQVCHDKTGGRRCRMLPEFSEEEQRFAVELTCRHPRPWDP